MALLWAVVSRNSVSATQRFRWKNHRITFSVCEIRFYENNVVHTQISCASAEHVECLSYFTTTTKMCITFSWWWKMRTGLMAKPPRNFTFTYVEIWNERERPSTWNVRTNALLSGKFTWCFRHIFIPSLLFRDFVTVCVCVCESFAISVRFRKRHIFFGTFGLWLCWKLGAKASYNRRRSRYPDQIILGVDNFYLHIFSHSLFYSHRSFLAFSTSHVDVDDTVVA